jgi:hypothetical protein
MRRLNWFGCEQIGTPETPAQVFHHDAISESQHRSHLDGNNDFEFGIGR